MQSPDYLRRMERVLATRVEAKKAKQAGPRRLTRAAGVIAGTLVCFFLLKAAAVAHDSRAFAGPPAQGAGVVATIAYWFAGADPISSTLAAALRNEPRRPAAPPASETL
ncbi:MAG: hypothetical protein ACK4GT_11970 [Pararhodobacter sp.]